MSDTPRTDAMLDKAPVGLAGPWADFARQLERELAAAKVQIESLQNFKRVAKSHVADLNARLDVFNGGGFSDASALSARYVEIVAERDALRADAERYRWLRDECVSCVHAIYITTDDPRQSMRPGDVDKTIDRERAK